MAAEARLRAHDRQALLLGAQREDWMRRGACYGTDPAMFFPDSALPEAFDQAKQVCAQCTVSGACLEYALATGQQHGVWGGRSEAELTLLRAERHLAAGRPVRGRPRSRETADA